MLRFLIVVLPGDLFNVFFLIYIPVVFRGGPGSTGETVEEVVGQASKDEKIQLE